MGYYWSSKLSAINSIILVTTTCAIIVSCFLPYWFTLVISPKDARYGTEETPENTVIHTGLYFMSDVSYVDMGYMDEITNHKFAPHWVIAAQLLYFSGSVGIGLCTVGCVILNFRKLGSVVGQFFLASFITISAMNLVLGVILAAFVFLGVDGMEMWRNLPLENPDRLASVVTPESIDVDLGFFIAIAVAVLALVSAGLGWLEAMKICRYIEDIRSKQLLDPDYGRKLEIAYTQFNYQQSYPDAYAVTVPGQPITQQIVYGEPGLELYEPGPEIYEREPHPQIYEREPGPQISQTVEI